MCDIYSIRGEECLCPTTGAPHYHAQSGLPDKGPAIKWLVVCSGYDLELSGPSKQSGPGKLSTVP